ncbi:MAG: aldehyde ferredoxin oxidoreductase family protein, partial [Desulfofustis sp.]|nr:aldehyde ferredoxin oxidoreductase family protein [Desulfofustis sp.]
MNGFNAKILRIDLTLKKITVEHPPIDFYRQYMGGRGFIVHYLLEEIAPGVDPLGPDNKLIFALGALTGHPFIGSGRNSIGAKSPLTGGFAESEAGGFWGAECKKAGYDAIIVEGASEKPVYLWVHNGAVEIRDAGTLWGSDVADCRRKIEQSLGEKNVRTAIIGIAGENMVRYACVLNDVTHAAGRTGMGAVMGSKKLKAIAVKGSQPPLLARREDLMNMNRRMAGNYKELTLHWKYGTGRTMLEYGQNGNLPVRNFKGGQFPGTDKISAITLYDRYLKKMEGCYGCPIKCKRVVELQGEMTVDPVYGGPEYETLAALGSNCDIDNLEAIMKANEYCNRYGLDTISTGAAISFAMECYDQGMLTMADTQGLELSMGNTAAMLTMIERIAKRKGLGDLLAEGTKRAAERLGKGSEAFAMQVKGEEIPMHEPRLKQSLGLHYSVHPAGADHCTGPHSETALDTKSAEKLCSGSTLAHLANHLGLCRFVPWKMEQLS